MEKRILFTTTISDLFTKRIIFIKKEVIKIEMFQTWLVKSIKEKPEMDITEEEIVRLMSPHGYMYTLTFETDTYIYKFLIEEVDFIN